MSELKFCELDYGEAIYNRKMREKAIADRVQAIKQSQCEQIRFENEFS